MERYAPGRHVHLEELLHEQPRYRVRLVEIAVLDAGQPLREVLSPYLKQIRLRAEEGDPHEEAAALPAG